MEKDFETEKIRTVGSAGLKQKIGTDVYIISVVISIRVNTRIKKGKSFFGGFPFFAIL